MNRRETFILGLALVILTIVLSRQGYGMPLNKAAQVIPSTASDRAPARLYYDRTILEEFQASSPWLIRASPDGTSYLTRVERVASQERHGLAVIGAGGKAVRYSMWARSQPVRILWRPDGKAVSYFLQEEGTNVRHLHLWDLASGRDVEIPIPLSYAQAFLRWSPDSARLAFTSDPGGVVVVEPATGGRPVWQEKIRAFDWSSDSQRIVMVPDKGKGVEASDLIIVDVATAEVIATINTGQDCDIRAVAWQGSERILFTAAEQHSWPTRLYAINPQGGQKLLLQSSEIAIEEPSWLPDNKGYAWQQGLADGLVTVAFSLDGPDPVPRLLKFSGSVYPRGYVQGRDSLVVSHTSFSENRLLEVPWNDLDGYKVLADVDGPKLPIGVDQQYTKINSLDGTPIPVHVSRIARDSPDSRNAALIRLHGTFLEGKPDLWEETRWYLSRGIQCIQVGGRSGTKRTAQNDTEDLVAACRYAHEELGVPIERIVVIAPSTLANTALRSVVNHPGHIGILVLIGVYEAPERTAYAEAENRVSDMRVLAFHGGSDRLIKPERAKAILDWTLGPDATRSPRGVWHVFDGEDHSLSKDESFAVIHATVLHMLGLIPLRGDAGGDRDPP